MKRFTKQLLVSLAMVLGLANAAHANGGDDCDARTLRGLYLFSASGFNISATGASIPKVIAEFIRFNGDGTLSVPGGTVIVGGVKLPPFPAGRDQHLLHCAELHRHAHVYSRVDVRHLRLSTRGRAVMVQTAQPAFLGLPVMQGSVVRVSR